MINGFLGVNFEDASERLNSKGIRRMISGGDEWEERSDADSPRLLRKLSTEIHAKFEIHEHVRPLIDHCWVIVETGFRLNSPLNQKIVRGIP